MAKRPRKSTSRTLRRILLLLLLIGVGFFASRYVEQIRRPSTPSETMTASVADDPRGYGVAEDGSFSPERIPPYNGSPAIPIHNNVPFFTEDELTTASFEDYGPLDARGRCTTCTACVGTDLLPTSERESISEVLPTGWHYTKYETIEKGYLYNRCHLIAYALTAENANERNLITGTRYLNYEGMHPFEWETIGYIHRTEHHVLYRVTPVFFGNDLVASGVLMEARSVEDDDLQFCVYCYNVQPGIVIDYATGNSRKE